jgi:ATP-dependent exoDNAse (exonuclease V) beta subunit
LAAARERHVEQEFLLAWPPGAAAAEARYLQGFIDCLYRDAAGAWHVLDYKTNQVDAGSLATAAAQYEMQMLVYALAVERVLSQPPSSIVLHFLRGGLEWEFKLDGKSKRTLIEMVNRSIDQLVREEGPKQQRLFSFDA